MTSNASTEQFVKDWRGNRMPVAHPGSRSLDRSAATGVWPHTNRVLPWLVAGFLIMLWLVPFDSTTAPFSIGVDSKLDRIVVVLIAGVWLLLACAGGRYGPRFRRSPLNVAILVFVVVAMASIASQLPMLSNLDLLHTNVKQLAVLLSYFTFFYIVATVVRREEVENFLKFMVILACVTAIGTVLEYRLHTNYFYSWTASLLKGFTVTPPPRGSVFGRPAVVGPTKTSLADATMLSIALSFGLVFLFRAGRRREQFLWFVALALLLAGTVSTGRKSAVLIPLATLVALTLYRPKQMLRFAPVLLVLVLSTYVIAPHAVTTLRYEFETVSTSISTRHRTAQYPGVVPYILAHPFLGIGWGSYASGKFGILDDQYLGLVVQTGFLGTAAFIGLLLTGVLLAHRATRSGDSALAHQGIALMGAIAGFAIASATYDVLGFPQAPYLLMFVLALTVVASDRVMAEARRVPETAPIAALKAASRGRDTSFGHRNSSQRDHEQRLRPRLTPGCRPTPIPGIAAPGSSARRVTPAQAPVSVTSRRDRFERLRRSLVVLAVGGSLLTGALGFVVGRTAGVASPAREVSRTYTLPARLNFAYADALNATFTKLNAVRTSAGSELALAHSARAQAAAARTLAVAHSDAAASVVHLDAGASHGANAALASAFEMTSNAYEAMARAAAHGDRTAYRQATASLMRADSALRTALGHLQVLGYSVDRGQRHAR